MSRRIISSHQQLEACQELLHLLKSKQELDIQLNSQPSFEIETLNNDEIVKSSNTKVEKTFKVGKVSHKMRRSFTS